MQGVAGSASDLLILLLDNKSVIFSYIFSKSKLAKILQDFHLFPYLHRPKFHSENCVQNIPNAWKV